MERVGDVWEDILSRMCLYFGSMRYSQVSVAFVAKSRCCRSNKSWNEFMTVPLQNVASPSDHR